MDFLRIWDIIEKELEFKTSRSGGPGGQSVNKLETKVIVFWCPKKSQLPHQTLASILSKIENQLDKSGNISRVCSETRSQVKNKELAKKRLQDLIKKSLIKAKIRKLTRPTKASKKIKEESKRRNSQTKGLRKKINPHDL